MKMKKRAHIANRPGAVVIGEKTLALCGEKWKVNVLWDDVPKDHPLCRDCVEVAITAMDEADTVIERARRLTLRLVTASDLIASALTPDNLILDEIVERQAEWADARATKQERKAAKKRAKQTCTCEWSETSEAIAAVSDDCPIHHHPEKELPPVAPEEGDDAKN